MAKRVKDTGLVPFSTRIEYQKWEQISELSLKTGKTVQLLVDDALRLLFQRYDVVLGKK